LREGYNRLKNILEKMMKQNKEQAHPRFQLQPVLNRPGGLPTFNKQE